MVRTKLQRSSRRHFILHVDAFAEQPASMLVPFFCSGLRAKLTCPDDLAIVLIHNFPQPSLMERCLDYVGIGNYTVVRPEITGGWYNAIKLVALREHLVSLTDPPKYVLYVDSSDALLCDEPQNIVDYFLASDCDLLLSSTTFRKDYDYMPEVEQFAIDVAPPGAERPYFNTGCYIARTEFLLELLGEAAQYIPADSLARREYQHHRRTGTLRERLAEFPRGVGCDQIILRYLHPRFHPRIKVDYEGRLALRG